MEMTSREIWTLIHGMGLGAVFLLAFAGGLAGLYSLRPELLTVTGMRERLTRLVAGTWLMALAAWGTVIHAVCLGTACLVAAGRSTGGAVSPRHAAG